jgi:hypothetical protein
VWLIMGWSFGCVNPKTKKFVFSASPLNTLSFRSERKQVKKLVGSESG